MKEHQPGSCFCRECRLRAQLSAPTLYGLLGQQPGEPTALRQVFAWCPWCANWHRHGDQTSQPGDVLHRVPHCTSHRSPYQERGYLVAVTNTPLADVYRHMKRSTFEQRQIIADGRTTPTIDRLRAQVLPILRPDHHGGWT